MTLQNLRRRVDQDNKADVYRSSLTMPLGCELSVTEEISLEPELINSLYRRGRRRLRDIQSNCGVNVWLDKLRGVLHLSGSKASVASAKHLIAGLGGPRKRISTAMWAELLRTRKQQSGPEAAVARIQLQSGCRLHVERTSQEVHLFGDSASVAIAEKLLMELDQDCAEEVITLDADPIPPTALQAIANSCDVTLQAEKDRLYILGLRGYVKKAIDALEKNRNNLESYLDIPAPIVTGNMEVKEANKVAAPVPVQSLANVLPKNDKVANKICPTCKACPFCAKCGHPTSFVDNTEASGFAAFGNNFPYGPPIFINSDYNINATSGMYQQLPFTPCEYGMVGGNVDNNTPMAFMIPNAQNVPVCFIPAARVPAPRTP
mmetsp:Transcript_84085/g.132392  ORF Transcript_84085/g.132392 Transcript_84085/m.132392 type:complete len:376 (+) Transcript_84085:53-1180(+)